MSRSRDLNLLRFTQQIKMIVRMERKEDLEKLCRNIGRALRYKNSTETRCLTNPTLKPVMVRIHGGCFTGEYGHGTIPNYFVHNDVVIVSINYRLGILGFLSTGDEMVPGNMGLKDQTEPPRWVQRNIAAFGGDPDGVTIFGQSAGGASIHYHTLSPMSKGLYKNAIAMSGSALNPWAFPRNATDRAIRFAQHLGYTGKTSNDLLKFLKDVDNLLHYLEHEIITQLSK
ncbi:venom carboxylesterase-6-like [Schistocerca gregaria]|uniref:venom carboxylesterase-6-like n=1 Tax=Schistocerca gregaria TaxID=7010 RepID=UPI00211EDDCB|nr:venom carboxylesterase-6-like [Schistocerca gregaria]